MTLSLLHYTFLDYPLPPNPCSEADKPPRPKAIKPLPPEARWLLWQWSRVVGLDQSTSCHARTLCQRLGTTPQQWSRIVRMLKASGVMVTCSVPQKRGRPLTEYRIAAQVRYDLQNLAVPEMCHRPEIERVLEAVERQSTAVEEHPPPGGRSANLLSAEARKRRLTPANRWLIAVLLAHAETPGRVSGLSYSCLEKLTGMSRNQLQSQISKLREQGILAHHQPGRLGRLFGSQMNSVFVLDLDHPLFGPESCVDVRVLLYSPRNKRRQFRTVVNGLVEALFVSAHYQAQATDRARRKEGREMAEQDHRVFVDAHALLPKAFDLGSQARKLARAYDADSANWLLARLHGYAEQLLSHGWDTLSAGRGG